MLFYNSDLTNPSGIYGANALYYLNGSSSSMNQGNDVYGWVSGELFAGLNIGAVGSQTLFNLYECTTSHMVGSLPSDLWFSIPLSFLFGGLEPEAYYDAKYYNQWAATLTPLSQAYNFAYSDRFASVFASLNPKNVASMKVTIEPATVQLSEASTSNHNQIDNQERQNEISRRSL